MLDDLALMAAQLSGRVFTPAALFQSGEQGVWYDPSDFSTMFQDSAGTTPVTAVEQPVGLIRDKSGRGNHASQSADISRPVLKQDANGMYYLLFDGSNDSLSTGTINPGSVDKAQVFAGIRKLSNAAVGVLVSTYTGASNGEFEITAPRNTTGDYGALLRGTANSQINTPIYAAPDTSVLTAIFNVAGATATDESQLRRNASLPTQTVTIAGPAGDANFKSGVVYIGRRGGSSLPYNGHLYGLIARFGSTLSASQIASAEAWMNSKTRAY